MSFLHLAIDMPVYDLHFFGTKGDDIFASRFGFRRADCPSPAVKINVFEAHGEHIRLSCSGEQTQHYELTEEAERQRFLSEAEARKLFEVLQESDSVPRDFNLVRHFVQRQPP